MYTSGEAKVKACARLRFRTKRSGTLHSSVMLFTQIMHARRQRLAPEGRRMMTHGVSRGSSSRSPAPAGAKESGWEINCYALSFAPPGLIHASAWSHG